MDPVRTRLLHKLIQLENTIGLLYACFAELFPEDQPFWRNLVLEESNHASLLYTHLEYILDSKELSDALLSTREETLGAILDRVQELLLEVKNKALSRDDAFNLALQLEQSAGEVHFQGVSNGESKDGSSTPFVIFEA